MDANDVRTDVTARYCLGRIAGGIGCLVIMGVLIWAGCHANDVIDKVSAQKDTMTPAMEISIWVSIGAHAAISIAAIYFGYSMLRLAERMLLPRHLLHDETKVNVVRALLGVKTPAESAVDGVKQISENLSTILKPIAELARVVLGTDSDKKK